MNKIDQAKVGANEPNRVQVAGDLQRSDAIELINAVRNEYLPAALNDIRRNYFLDDKVHLLTDITKGCDYWFMVFDKVIVAKTIEERKGIMSQYVCLPTDGQMENKFNIVQAIMKCYQPVKARFFRSRR